MINNVTLIGRLTADPAVKSLEGDVKVAHFTLAVDKTYRNRGGERDTSFIPIVAWRKTAEIVEKFLHKGSMCAVQGSIETRSYDPGDGTKRYVTEILAGELQVLTFLDKASEEEQGD